MATYGSGSVPITTPTGNEKVSVDNGGAVLVTLTAQQIANLSGKGSFAAITALNTVGAGTITAAGLIGGVTKRGGSQSNTAFTDTTATGAQLDAALTNPQVGQSWYWDYQNTTNATATLAGGTGVTASGITAAPANTVVRTLVTRTAAATYTIVGFQITAPNATDGTFTANGASAVTVADTNITANSAVIITLKTVGGTVGAVPAIKTITAGTGFTVAGTASDTSVYNYLIIN